MKQVAFLFLLAILCTQSLSAQQLPRFTQYRNYRGILNPAAIHADYLPYHGFYTLSVGLSHRQEGGAAFSDVPVTQSLQIEWLPSWNVGRNFEAFGGAYLVQDAFGAERSTVAAARLGVLNALPNGDLFSVGFSLGTWQYRLDGTATNLLQVDDPLQSLIRTQQLPVLGFGAFYNKRIGQSHDLYVGLAAPQFYQLDLDKLPIDAKYPQKLAPTWTALLGAYWYVSDYSFWETSLWATALPDESIDWDANVRYQFRQAFWLGAGYSSRSVLHGEFGVQLFKARQQQNRLVHRKRPIIQLGFGYDYVQTPLVTRLDHAFELNLNVCLP